MLGTASAAGQKLRDNLRGRGGLGQRGRAPRVERGARGYDRRVPALLVPHLALQLVGNTGQRNLLAAIAEPGASATEPQADGHR